MKIIEVEQGMDFCDAFKLLRQGKTLIVEDTEYRLGSTFPPSIMSRPKGRNDLNWEERIKDYILFILASTLWEISDENN